MDNFANRLKMILEEKDIKQSELAKMTGIDKALISHYIKGTYAAKQTNLFKIAKALNVSEAYLMGYDISETPVETPSHTYKTTMIPVVGKVAAGEPIEAIEDILDYVDIPEEMSSHGNYFGLRIKGHSMEPRIWDGDTVIVKQQEWVEDGQIAVVIVDGYDATCKKVHYSENGVTLVALNPVYEPMFFSKDTTQPETLKVIGRVVEIRSRV